MFYENPGINPLLLNVFLFPFLNSTAMVMTSVVPSTPPTINKPVVRLHHSSSIRYAGMFQLFRVIRKTIRAVAN